MNPRHGGVPRRAATLISLASLVLAGNSLASFKSGYADNQCTVTIASIAVEKPGGYTSSDPVLITYNYACPNSINYSIKVRQSKYGDIPTYLANQPIVERSVVNSCMPDRVLDNPAPTYDEAKKSIVVHYSTYPGVSTCKDLGLPVADGAFATAISGTKVGQISWSSPTDVVNSVSAWSRYNSGDFTVSLPFANRVLPSKTFTGSGSSWQDGDASIVNERWFAKITYARDTRYFAIVHLLPGFNDNDYYNKPLIVGDAFDPFNQRGFTQAGDNGGYQNIRGSAKYTKLISAGGPRSKGYDIYFLDFAQGAGDIHVNAGIELKFIEWLSARSKKMIVGGMSMSGLIARMAMLYSMPANNTAGVDYGTKVKGYLSIDSPHQGASISADLQGRMYYLKNNWVVQLGEYFTGAKDASENWGQLSRPAALQMLYEHYYPDASANPSGGHDSFYDHMWWLGNYRGDLASSAIAYSNFYQNWYPGWDYRVIGASIAPPSLGPYDIWVKNYEFDPGSTGDWYWDSYKASSPSYMNPKSLGNPLERFKGTFIPINSALDVTGNYVNTKPANYALSAASPFNFTYYMKHDYNGYCDVNNACKKLDAASRRQTVEDKRFVHIIFDGALINTINTALDAVESSIRTIDGDKYDDLLFYQPGGGLHASRSNGSGFAYSGNWYADPYLDMSYMLMGDFNGDGFMDLGYQDGSNAFKVALSDGTRFQGFTQWIPPSPGGWGHRGGKLYAGDFNGDRKDDLLFFEPSNNTLHVSLSSGSAFGAAGSGQWIGSNGFGSLKDNYLIGDFNGDGKADLGYWEGNQTFQVRMSSGTGFGTSSQWIPPYFFGNTTATPYIGDFNGDGRDDLMFFQSPSQSLYLLASTGSRFASTTQQWTTYQSFGTNPASYYPADYNGDGFCDMGYFESADNTFKIVLTNASGTGFNPKSTWVSPDAFGHSGGRYFTTYRKKRILIN